MIGTHTGMQGEVSENGIAHMPAPEFIEMMHRSIMDELVELQGKGARSGRAARDVLELFRPHVTREEAQLLPVITALSAISFSGGPPVAGAGEAITRFLESGLLQLEADHRIIRRALAEMKNVAEEEDDLWLYDVATRLAYHLNLEDKDYFPKVEMNGALFIGSMEIAGIQNDGGTMMGIKA